MNKLTVFYDNWCPNCSSFAKLMKKHDLLDKIIIVEFRNLSIEESRKFLELDKEIAKRQMATYSNLKYSYGFESIFKIFIRIPLFGFLSLYYTFLK